MNSSEKHFVPDDNPCVEEMTCSVCLHVWMDPTELRPCTHTYCSSCISELGTCPDCRSRITGKGRPSRILTNLLYVLGGSCSRCGWRGTHGEYSTHHSKESCAVMNNSPAASANKVVNKHEDPMNFSNQLPFPVVSSQPASSDNFMRQVSTSSASVGMGGRGDAALHSINEDGLPTCMLFPTLPDPDDQFGNATGLEKTGLNTTVMISTASKPWREYNLTRSQFEAIQLAFFAFADCVSATQAPFPQMAEDDRDRPTAGNEVGQQSVPLSRRSALLLRPEAVKRCLWWLNVPQVAHDLIVDELFPAYDIHLPLIPTKISRVNEGLLPRPTEGPLSFNAADGGDASAYEFMVYGVTLHQLMNWLGWHAADLAPHLSEYGLSQQQYDALLESTRSLDTDQTGAFDPEAVKEIVKSLVNIRSRVAHDLPSLTGANNNNNNNISTMAMSSAVSNISTDGPRVSIRPAEVLRILMDRRNAAMSEAAGRNASKTMLVGPSYPPGEFLLHDVLMACRQTEVSDDWCDIDEDDVSTTSAKTSLSLAGTQSIFQGGGHGHVTVPNRPTTAAEMTTPTTPAPKVGLFQKLFGKKKDKETPPPPPAKTAAPMPPPAPLPLNTSAVPQVQQPPQQPPPQQQQLQMQSRTPLDYQQHSVPQKQQQPMVQHQYSLQQPSQHSQSTMASPLPYPQQVFMQQNLTPNTPAQPQMPIGYGHPPPSLASVSGTYGNPPLISTYGNTSQPSPFQQPYASGAQYARSPNLQQPVGPPPAAQQYNTYSGAMGPAPHPAPYPSNVAYYHPPYARLNPQAPAQPSYPTQQIPGTGFPNYGANYSNYQPRF